MSVRTILSVIFAVVLLTGCGAGPRMPPLPRDHPASPDAETGPAPILPRTLEVDEPVQRPGPLEESMPDAHENHADPGGDEKAMPPAPHDHGGH